MLIVSGSKVLFTSARTTMCSLCMQQYSTSVIFADSASVLPRSSITCECLFKTIAHSPAKCFAYIYGVALFIFCSNYTLVSQTKASRCLTMSQRNSCLQTMVQLGLKYDNCCAHYCVIQNRGKTEKLKVRPGFHCDGWYMRTCAYTAEKLSNDEGQWATVIG